MQTGLHCNPVWCTRADRPTLQVNPAWCTHSAAPQKSTSTHPIIMSLKPKGTFIYSRLRAGCCCPVCVGPASPWTVLALWLLRGTTCKTHSARGHELDMQTCRHRHVDSHFAHCCNAKDRDTCLHTTCCGSPIRSGDPRGHAHGHQREEGPTACGTSVCLSAGCIRQRM